MKITSAGNISKTTGKVGDLQCASCFHVHCWLCFSSVTASFVCLFCVDVHVFILLLLCFDVASLRCFISEMTVFVPDLWAGTINLTKLILKTLICSNPAVVAL